MNATDFKALVAHWAQVMQDNRDYLIELDGVVGDSDLGLTMSDGFAAASAAIADSAEEDLGKLSYSAGKAMSTAVPSTMGTLMASGFMQAGKALRGKTELGGEGVLAFFQAYFDGVQNRGKAAVGDKTFLDGLAPALDVLKAACGSAEPAAEIAAKAAAAAHGGFLATKGMLAKHGRAAGRGEASRDLLDPGAAVADLLMKGYSEFRSENG